MRSMPLAYHAYVIREGKGQIVAACTSAGKAVELLTGKDPKSEAWQHLVALILKHGAIEYGKYNIQQFETNADLRTG